MTYKDAKSVNIHMANIIIATTTINPPTKALIEHTKIHDYKIVVVGDKKTPHELYKNIKNVVYLSPEEQEKKYKDLSDAIGWNAIERRNIAILEAYNLGAEVIGIIDDDNIPYKEWSNNVKLNEEIEVNYFKTDNQAFDPLYMTNSKKFWHRGFPLELVEKRNSYVQTKKTIVAAAQIDLWDGDPDIDAVMRTIYNPKLNIKSKYFPFSSNKMVPFNSQNTFIHRNYIKDYFLFPGIGRNHDIFAAYYFQACGNKVVVQKPSVLSDRSLGTTGRYSYINDMKSEYYSLERVFSLVNDLNNGSEHIFKYLPESAINGLNIWRDYF